MNRLIIGVFALWVALLEEELVWPTAGPLLVSEAPVTLSN